MGNPSVDETDAAATTTFFFTTDGKSFVPTFNCSFRNMRKCGTTRLLVNGVLNMGGSDEGEGGGTSNDAVP
jgi:hypothetical protein